MNETLPGQTITGSELAESIDCTLNRKYGTLLHAARKAWEENFAADDPSDACVTLRISSDERALSSAQGNGRIAA